MSLCASRNRTTSPPSRRARSSSPIVSRPNSTAWPSSGTPPETMGGFRAASRRALDLEAWVSMPSPLPATAARHSRDQSNRGSEKRVPRSRERVNGGHLSPPPSPSPPPPRRLRRRRRRRRLRLRGLAPSRCLELALELGDAVPRLGQVAIGIVAAGNRVVAGLLGGEPGLLGRRAGALGVIAAGDGLVALARRGVGARGGGAGGRLRPLGVGGGLGRAHGGQAGRLLGGAQALV